TPHREEEWRAQMTSKAHTLRTLLQAKTTADVEQAMTGLPIVDLADFHMDNDGFHGKWRTGHLHWLPVGLRRGNAGSIKLASQPTNPIAERLINGMEAIIELERQKELLASPTAPMPTSPRDAVLRYFGLPRLDSVPRVTDPNTKQVLEGRVKQLRELLFVQL